jgi:hypothetical protein
MSALALFQGSGVIGVWRLSKDEAAVLPRDFAPHDVIRPAAIPLA